MCDTGSSLPPSQSPPLPHLRWAPEARHSASSSDETAHVRMYVRLIKAMISVVHSSIISLKDESTTIPNVFLIVIASLWWCYLEVESKSVGSTLISLSKSYAPLTSPTVRTPHSSKVDSSIVFTLPLPSMSN